MNRMILLVCVLVFVSFDILKEKDTRSARLILTTPGIAEIYSQESELLDTKIHNSKYTKDTVTIECTDSFYIKFEDTQKQKSYLEFIVLDGDSLFYWAGDKWVRY